MDRPSRSARHNAMIDRRNPPACSNGSMARTAGSCSFFGLASPGAWLRCAEMLCRKAAFPSAGLRVAMIGKIMAKDDHAAAYEMDMVWGYFIRHF